MNAFNNEFLSVFAKENACENWATHAIAAVLPNFELSDDIEIIKIDDKTYAKFWLNNKYSYSSAVEVLALLEHKTLEKWFQPKGTLSPEDMDVVEYDGWQINAQALAVVTAVQDMAAAVGMPISIERHVTELQEYLDEHAEYLFLEKIADYEPDFYEPEDY